MKKSELKKIIREEVQQLLEAVSDKIYIDGDTIWLSYAPGSGNTIQLRNMKTYFTDKSGDSHFNGLVPDIVKWAQHNKPIKKVNDKYLFEIPVYDLRRHRTINSDLDIRTSDLEIWGGHIKPIKKYYMFVSAPHPSVVSFFDRKGEALNWIKPQKYYEEIKNVLKERIDFKEIDKALKKYKTKKQIEDYVEYFLGRASNYDFAQQELISYVTDQLYDDKLRLLWTNVIQSF